MMKRKKFDIKTGHYVILEEDNTTVSATQPTDGREETQQQNNQQTNTDNKSVESNKDIQAVNNELAEENKKYSANKESLITAYNKAKETQTALLNSAMSAVSDTNSAYDSVQTNPDVLAIKKKLAEIELNHIQELCKVETNHAQKVYDIEMKRINITSKIATETYNRLPEKYRHINESNVQNAKIYLDILIGEDKLLTGMPDFKNAFKESDLVYGKDKKGYFVLCIDREDFDKLYKVMNEVGYPKDVVFSIVMSQVLDRSDFIVSNQ